MTTELQPIVYLNIRAHTLGANGAIHEAIVIANGKITYVGDRRGASVVAPNANVIDVSDKFAGNADLYPGFVDAHAHVYGTGERMLRPRLEGLNSIEEIVAKLAPLMGGTDWIIARGWDQNRGPGKRLPISTGLETLGLQQPIALTRIDGHALWCNRAALQIAGIDAETPDPFGGKILRESTGQPTGILIDEAMKLIERHIPIESDAETENVLRAGLRRFAETGHVAVHDMGVDARVWDAFQALYAKSGDELIRAWVFLDMNKESGKQRFLEYVRSGEPIEASHPRLQFAGIKIYLDGALGSRGANLFEAYSDDQSNTGLRLSDDAELLELMNLASERKLQIAVHAIGDAAVSRALNLFERISKRGATLRIEHTQMVQSEDLSRFAALNVHAVVQPAFFRSDRHWAIERIGRERMRTAYRWKSFLDRGVNLVASSDSPVETPDTLSAMKLLESRDSIQDGEVLTRLEAERASMQSVYRITGESEVAGEIAVGARADLTFVRTAENSDSQSIFGTMIEGTWIYEGSGSDHLAAA